MADVAKNRSSIKKFSGGHWLALPIANEVTGPVVGDTGWLELGYVQEATLNDSTEQEDVIDESGGVVNVDDVTRSVKINGLLMQSDADTIKFFKETVRGKYYTIYHYDGINDSKYQEYIFGICQIKPMIEIASGTKRIPFEITVLKNDSNIPLGDTGEVALPVVGDGYACHLTTGDIAAGIYYDIYETAVS